MFKTFLNNLKNDVKKFPKGNIKTIKIKIKNPILKKKTKPKKCGKETFLV